MDLFYSADIKSILHNKFVVIIGDSIQRGIYKDLVLLLQENRYLRERELRDKGEYSFHGDELIEGGRKGEMTNGINYTEVRQYVTDVHLVRFYFSTRCYNAYIESILSDLKVEPYPDIVIMNSCLWDITRYGSESINDYKTNMVTLMDRFKEVLPNDCLMIWNATLPISSQAKGGFLIPEINFMTTTLRLDILEANYYARSIIVEHGFDILDLHFYLRHHLDKRVRDGIHWDMMAHRYITNLLMSHVCKAFGIPNPSRKSAPFCSYPRQNQYRESIIPAENDFGNANFLSSPILQLCKPKSNNQRKAKVEQPLLPPRGQRDRPPLMNLHSTWNDVFATTMNTIHGMNSAWNRNGHNAYGCDPHWRFGSSPHQRHRQNTWEIQQAYNGPVQCENFSGPVFPQGQNQYFKFGDAKNDPYFGQASFQPYQQDDYQGASHSRKRNRHRPYNGNY